MIIKGHTYILPYVVFHICPDIFRRLQYLPEMPARGRCWSREDVKSDAL
jgi:hypothetical protein